MAVISVESKPPVSTTSTTSPLYSLEQRQKASLNVSTLEAHDTNLSAKDTPLALTLRAVIDKLNTLLEPDFGTNAIDTAIETEVDVSPEATADRIVSLSTAFFPAFQKANPGESNEEALTHFLDVIRGGIDQGFNEAREILGGLGVLEGDIESNIDRTYELVQEKLDAFKEYYSSILDGAEEKSST